MVRTFEAMNNATSMGRVNLFALRLFLQNRDLGLEIRRLNVGDQSPLKPRAEPVLNLREFLRRTIRRDHDLLHALVQSVESVEELLLRPFLLRDELNVVDEQNVHGAEAIAEAGHAVVAQRGDHLVGELLCGNVADAGGWLASLYFVADGVHQVGLAHAHAAIQEERDCMRARAARPRPEKLREQTGCHCR